MDGHKVQIVQNFRGREMIHKSKGYDRMRDIESQMSDIAKVEMSPRQAGRRMTMMLSPDKAKIDQIKRKKAAEAEADKAEKNATKPPAETADPATEATSA